MPLSNSDAAARARSELARHAIEARWSKTTDPAQRKAATRPARIVSAVKTVTEAAEELSEDQRRAIVRAQVAASRKAQGLPEHVTDAQVLGQLAADVLGGGHDDAA